jgi:hypothetical protein
MLVAIAASQTVPSDRRRERLKLGRLKPEKRNKYKSGT